MEELQSNWKIPCIGQFISLFRFAFKLPEMDIEDLEESIVVHGTHADSGVLQEVCTCLLKGCYPKKHIDAHNWESYLCQYLNQKWTKEVQRPNPISDGQSFSKLDFCTKINILYFLCLTRLDCGDAEAAMKNMDGEALRVQSLGSDSLGNVYWYFYGTRLYKEEPSPNAKNYDDWEEEWKKQNNNSVIQKRGRGRPRKSKPDADVKRKSRTSQNLSKNSFLELDSKSRWSVVCTSLEDWEIFAKKLKNSKVKCEITLYNIITKNFLPTLSEIYAERDKNLKKKLLQLTSERPSTRLNAKIQNQTNAHDQTQLDKCQSSSASEEEEEAPRKKRRKRTSRSRSQQSTRNSKGSTPTSNDHRAVRQTRVTSSEIHSNEISSSHTANVDRKFDIILSQEPEMFMKLRSVLTRIKLHRNSWPFLNAVDEAIAPGYYDIVKDPIDLSAIERKIQLNAYHSVKQIEEDFQKMVYNCRLYNGPKSNYTKMAQTLLDIFREDLIHTHKQAIQNKSDEKKVVSPDSQKTIISRKKSQTKHLPTKPKRKLRFRKRKKIYLPTMQGLNMLAEASEQALKEVNSSETELYVPGNQSATFKSKAFPDLKIVPLQSHPPSFLEKYSASSHSSSDSDANQQDLSALSPCSQHSNDGKPSSTSGQKNSKACVPSKQIISSSIIQTPYVMDSSYIRKPALRTVRTEDDDKAICPAEREATVSPDSCNNISNVLSPGTDSSCSDKLSGSEAVADATKNITDLDDTCNMLGIANESSRSDALSSLSSLLCRIIKDNQDFQAPDIQSLTCGMEVNERTLNRHSAPSSESLSPQNEHLAKSPMENQLVFNCRSHESSVQQLDTFHSLEDMRPLNHMTTIDASVLGLSSSAHICTSESLVGGPEEPFRNVTTPVPCGSPEHKAEDSDGFACDNQSNECVNDEPPVLSASLSYPASSAFEKASDDNITPFERVSDAAKSKPCSPDSQTAPSMPFINVNSTETPPPHISSNDFCSSNQQNNGYTPCPVQIANSPPRVTAQNLVIPSSVYNDSDAYLPKTLPSLPLQLPVPNGTLPLFFSQGHNLSTTLPLATTAGQVALVPSSSQQILKPVASFGINPVSSMNLPQTTHVSGSLPELQLTSKKSVPQVKSGNMKSSSTPKPKKKRRSLAPKPQDQHINYSASSPYSQQLNPSNSLVGGRQNSNGHQSNISSAENVNSVHFVPDSSQNKVSSSNFNYRISNSSVDYGNKNNHDFNFIPVSTAVNSEQRNSSIPVFAPYNVNGSSDNLRIGVTDSNSFLGAKDSPTIYSIPVTHSMPFHPLLVPQPHNTNTTMCSSNSSVMTSDNRLHSICPVPTSCVTVPEAMERSSNNAKNSPKNFSSVPSISPNSLFSSFPLIYAVPNTSPDMLHQNTVSSAISCTKDTLGTTTSVSCHPYMLQGLPPRPIQDISEVTASQQLRHPNYLSVPHYMIPAPPPLPAPLVPSYTVHGSGEAVENMMGDSNSPQARNKTSPVYTVLQNVPMKSRQ